MPRSLNPLRSLHRGLIATAAVMAMLVGATLWFGAKTESRDALVNHAIAVQAQITEVIDLVQTAESSQRGYLLMGRDAYLAPFGDAVGAMPQALARMAALVGHNVREREAVTELQQLIPAKLAELRSTIDKRRDGRVHVALGIVETDKGLHEMNRIRQLGSTIEDEEQYQLKRQEANLATDRMFLQFGAGGSLLLIGAIVTLVGFFVRRSFTDLAAAHDQLAATNQALVQQTIQRESAEDQLRQAQKMEAIGQLTGGIAHDFNNMLGVIAGSLDLIRRRLKRGDFKIDNYVNAAVKATERSAALTHRLLAFARRQPLSPEVLDPSKMISGMSDLLHSTLGGQISIRTVLMAGLWRINADANQLESALLNLALNARHAMPEAGKLTIETANTFLDDAYCKQNAEVQPGQYVMIAMTDTGTGMAPEVLARAFDPFFTTRPAGTGLGLSQVYGFVKQSHGHITIYSEVGAGTTVKIYLPRFMGEGESAQASTAQARAGTPGEVILVVEDDALVRRHATEVLGELGYTVLDAANAAEAIVILESRSDIRLLFTDVVMPETNGKKLADKAVDLHPDLKVLFTTGYTHNAVIRGGVLEAGTHLLTKPFTLEQLAEKVRSMLDQ